MLQVFEICFVEIKKPDLFRKKDVISLKLLAKTSKIPYCCIAVLR